ncbi:hypothetical protein EYF80_049868 [Liparis tanakae]|uniref:Secreted protein n=1 Tax=Liparis tanakae TaxID=230148 RepID=A0A4Z2FG98_9TELE|nr:hypothetical protein EYF80_049868 [Liparis tanakae]
MSSLYLFSKVLMFSFLILNKTSSHALNAPPWRLRLLVERRLGRCGPRRLVDARRRDISEREIEKPAGRVPRGLAHRTPRPRETGARYCATCTTCTHTRNSAAETVRFTCFYFFLGGGGGGVKTDRS